MSDDLGLAGRGTLVNGGTQGIGEAVVARLLEAAVTVLITARRVRRWTSRSGPVHRGRYHHR
jgi:NAD(P)-dependent dehydrogenase (short-subunit alcohol dehydrogenase family)